MFRALSLVLILISLASRADQAPPEAPDYSFAGLVTGFQTEFAKPEQKLFSHVFPMTRSIIIKPLHEADQTAKFSPGLTRKVQFYLVLNICKKGQDCEEMTYPLPGEVKLKIKNDDQLGLVYDLSHIGFEFENADKLPLKTDEGKPISVYMEVTPMEGNPMSNDTKSQLQLMDHNLVVTDGQTTEKLKLVPRLIFR